MRLVFTFLCVMAVAMGSANAQRLLTDFGTATTPGLSNGASVVSNPVLIYTMKRILIVWVLLVSFSCAVAQKLVDRQATDKTKALDQNLKKIGKAGILFGHQDSDAYGVKWKDEAGRSDIKDVCGDYPAIHGWDLGNLGKQGQDAYFKKMHQSILDTYKRGGISTVSWHADNPVSKKDAWDTTHAVYDILPGGKTHAYFVQQLDLVADFLENCKDGNASIPIIFRPYHEHNGNWFWWGKGLCSEKEYIQLWQFTVKYLRDTRKLHNLIYAFSPDRSRIKLEEGNQMYLYAYPGDDYVDILGLDDYMDVGVTWNKKSATEQQQDFITVMRIVSRLAKEKNKVAALTETGLEGVTHPQWFTQVILEPLKANRDIDVAYILVWRNDNEKHHYAPYLGHTSAPDFVRFYQDERSLFEGDIQNMYLLNKPLIK
ncbi:glycoside hydrolase family 26 protein [Ohtaekwangia sp.]|uniref:glycoside hydrolase family 26 protein n=1 Tax=Ohtaekwangia sp. TaxID=2066019 RepID=UPI002FDE4990